MRSRHCFRFRLPKNGTPRHLAIITVFGSVAFVLGEQRISLGGSARADRGSLVRLM